MATGWAEFLKEITRRKARRELDHENVWEEFQRLATASERAKTLELAVRLGKKLPAGQRYLLALVVTRLLAPVEWPLEWAAIRPRLVTALERLLREANPHAADTFPALLDLVQSEGELHAAGYAGLAIACSLLRQPCRRDELRIVGQLCNTGNIACIAAYRQGLSRLGATPMKGRLLDARMRYGVAFQQYAHVARELNDACGAVLFTGLDARIDAPED